MWFGVSLLAKGDSRNRAEDDILWEESIVLVDADSEEDAKRIGERIGRGAEQEYESATGEVIRWTFCTVAGVYRLTDDEFRTGTEVFSRFLRASEARSLLTPFDD